jgi:hypothetical protein
MMSTMMAAGQRRLVEGPQLHGSRGTAPAPQQLSATNKRLHDVGRVVGSEFFAIFLSSY